jgi:hypothetical protein
MKTFYKSDITGKTYDNEDEAVKDEAEYKKTHEKELALRDEKASKAKAVQEAYSKYVKLCNDNRKVEDKAYNEFLGLRNEFVKNYGYFHMTFSDVEEPTEEVPDTIRDAFDWLLNPFTRF